MQPTSQPPRLGTTDHVPTVLGENPFAPSPGPAAFVLPAGTTLAHFEVTGPLGSGGMATVFRAKDNSLGREVALKILPPEMARDPDAVNRFKFEARAAAKLNHDQIARVFHTGEDKGLHFIAFEYVDGRTLRDVIDQGGPVPPSDAVRYMIDAAAGLQHAAEKGVVHRDVKPSNIIITPAGRAKLIDMGLARSIDPHSVNGGVTQSGMTLGTFDYISPEQAIDPRKADVRSDIYSLGCTFYHALTARPPVPDGNAARKLAAHQGEQPTDPRLINSAIPDALAAVLDRMMAKNPEHRYPTAAALIADLAHVGFALGVLEGTESSVTVPVREASAGLSRSAVFSVAVAAMSLLVVMMIILAATHRPNTVPVLPWSDQPAKPTPAPTEPAPNEPPPPRTVPTTVLAKTVDELRKAIKDGVPKVLLEARDYDLSEAEATVARAKNVEIEGPVGGVAVLKLAAVPRAERPGEGRPGALTFNGCDRVKLSHVRFEFTQPADDPRPVGLVFFDVGAVTLSDCRFQISDVTAGDGAVMVFTKPGPLTVKHCNFQCKALTAMDLPAGMKADFTGCGFLASRAALEVLPGDPTTMSLTHCSFLLNGTMATAVSVAKGGRCDLTAGHCLFGAPADTPAMGEFERCILRADVADGNTFTATMPNARFRVDAPTGSAVDELTTNPWGDAKPTADNLFAVLSLNPKLPTVRVGAKREDILGVKQWAGGGKVYAILPPLVQPGVAIWQPNLKPEEKERQPDNVYADLQDAVQRLKGKGTVLVRGTGTFDTPAPRFAEGMKAITIRAEEGSTPTLRLTPADDRLSQLSFFKLESGDLTLDGLRFEVKKGKADAAAVVVVTGGRRCELKRCVVTLDDEAAAAVTVADAREVMMKKDFTDRPAVKFEGCLIRGKGQAVRLPAAVPADITAENTAIVTAGPAAFEVGAPLHSGDVVSVRLTRVTAATAGPLLSVHAARKSSDDTKPTPMVRIDVTADGCLFVPLGKSAEPLVRAQGFDPAAAEKGVSWAATGGGYGGWKNFAEWVADDGSDTKPWDAADWRKWTGEPTTPAGSLLTPPTAKGVTEITPAKLDVTDAGMGAKVAGLPK